MPDLLEGFDVGCVVHYVREDCTHCAALVTALGGDTTMGECELQLAVPQFGWLKVDRALFDPHEKSPGTWHWPEARKVTPGVYNPTTERK